MTISSRAALVLAELTEAFDDPGVNFRRSLSHLGGQVRMAVPSYLGVSLTMTSPRSSTQVEVMDDGIAPDGIGSSLRIPATAILNGRDSTAATADADIALILYAGVPGALVDLAADLGWLTGLPGSDFALDQHLTGPQSATAEPNSTFNQAIGVLLGRGETPQQAEVIIAVRAATEGISAQATAAAILREVSERHSGPIPSS